MTRSLYFNPGVIATAALLPGLAIYCFARPDSVFYLGGDLAWPFIGQLPTFLHTLAFALASSIIVSPRPLTAIVSWGLLEILAELAQHDLAPVPAALLRYQQASTFDPWDLVSVLAAVVLAVGIHFTHRYHHK